MQSSSLTSFLKKPSFKVNFFIQLLFISFITLVNTMVFGTPISLEVPLKFKTLSTLDGLSQSYVFSITQDQQGFIWIATEDGLNKYDGQTFIHYRHNTNNKYSIADNFIRKVFIDKQKTLWVATDNGLSKYNPVLDNFINYHFTDTSNSPLPPQKNTETHDNTIWNIYQDNKGILWVTTARNIYRYNAINDTFSRVTIKETTTQLRDIKTLFQDQNNNYWVGTYDQGIFISNENFSYLQSLQKNNKWQLTIPATSLYDIKEIDQNYWLATNNGLYIINRNYQIVKHLTIENTNQQLLSNEIRTIEQFDEVNVWLGTRNGLTIYNFINQKFKQYQSSANPKDKGLSQNWILTIFKDNSHRMWLGNLGTGIDIYNPITSLFQHKLFNKSASINSLAQTQDGKIWFSSEQLGLNYFYPTEQTATNVAFPEAHNIYMLKAYKNTLWLLTYSNELYQYSVNNNVLIHHKKWAKKANLDITYSFLIAGNNLWFINTQGQLTTYNIKMRSFLSFNAPQKNERLQALQFANTTGQPHKIWLTSNKNHLYQFNVNTLIFKLFSLSIPEDYQLSSTKNIIESTSQLWLSSYEQGVLKINKGTFNATVFNETNGLINNNINALAADAHNNIWISSTKSISLITPNTNTIKNYSYDYGLFDNELLKRAALITQRNNIIFGGLNGFITFKPTKVAKIQQTIPTPVLTQLLVANKPVAISPTVKNNVAALNQQHNAKDKNFTISQHINQLKKLTLAYNQSPFSIEFIAPNAKIPSHIAYRYRLLALEKNWLEAGEHNKRATYTNLSAGDYIFQVQVYDRYHPEQVKTKQLNVTILPPWWLSNYALFIYTLMGLLIIAYFVQHMRQRRAVHMRIQQSEERLKLSLWGSGDEMWDWNITTGKIYRSNIVADLEFPQDGCRNASKTQQKILQNTQLTTAEKALALQKNSNIHPQDILRVYQAIKDHKQGKSLYFEATYRVKNNNEQWIWVLDRGKIVDQNHKQKPTRMTGTLKNISTIKNAEEKLKLFAQCIESISDAMVIYNRQFRIIDVNCAFENITGKTKQQVLHQRLNFDRYDEHFNLSVKRYLLRHNNWHGEIEEARPDGKLFYIDLNIDIIRDENNNISHYVGVFSDISGRKKNEAELIKLANIDGLTGLPNRSSFQTNQANLVKHHIKHALLIFDLDHFKKINDSLGHEVGDHLLCQVAQRIKKAAHHYESLYRLGGDEFSLIIENTTSISTISTLAKSILNAIAQPLRLKNHELVLHSSIGIVLYPDDGNSPQELLKKADTAMYHAKDNGGNRYQFFNESMNKKAMKRLHIENLIRIGLKKDYFSVHYQPKIELGTGKISGMEALVRFNTPSKGMISPVVFIPVSEETGQIIEIGEMVLRKACFATKRWVDAGLFNGRIAVNLSAVQFSQPNIVKVISNILVESGLDPRYLELEITEGTVMDSPQKAIAIMMDIRAMGIHLALDDFGTGYSSLAYLKRFPLNTLKIDKAFIDDIDDSDQGCNMVATIITIAHNLGLQVVAEGVEEEKQLNILATLKCEQLQGYLYSKPLSEPDFYQYLLAQQASHKIQ